MLVIQGTLSSFLYCPVAYKKCQFTNNSCYEHQDCLLLIIIIKTFIRMHSFTSQSYLDCRVLNNSPFKLVLSENEFIFIEDIVGSFILLFSWAEGGGIIIIRKKPVEQNIPVQGDVSN